MEIKSVKSRNNQGCHKANVLIHMTDSDYIGLIIKEEISEQQFSLGKDPATKSDDFLEKLD